MELKLTDDQVATILATLDIMAEYTTDNYLVLCIHDARAAVQLQLREAIIREMTNG